MLLTTDHPSLYEEFQDTHTDATRTIAYLFWFLYDQEEELMSDYTEAFYGLTHQHKFTHPATFMAKASTMFRRVAKLLVSEGYADTRVYDLIRETQAMSKKFLNKEITAKNYAQIVVLPFAQQFLQLARKLNEAGFERKKPVRAKACTL